MMIQQYIRVEFIEDKDIENEDLREYFTLSENNCNFYRN